MLVFLKAQVHRAFTLIELLIVVAIIAILAAIAVPNFLEAQTRAKVSRATADMRSISTAVEMYTVDHNRTPTMITGYPGAQDPRGGPSLINPRMPGTKWTSYRFRRLTTPIAYLNSVVRDVFASNGINKAVDGATNTYDSFDYTDQYMDADNPAQANKRWAAVTSGAAYRIASAGPDLIQAYGGASVTAPLAVNQHGVDYDASNGTISIGDIVRVGGSGKITSEKPAIDRINAKYNVSGL